MPQYGGQDFSLTQRVNAVMKGVYLRMTFGLLPHGSDLPFRLQPRLCNVHGIPSVHILGAFHRRNRHSHRHVRRHIQNESIHGHNAVLPFSPPSTDWLSA